VVCSRCRYLYIDGGFVAPHLHPHLWKGHPEKWSCEQTEVFFVSDGASLALGAIRERQKARRSTAYERKQEQK
jgi:hypothetical protein